MPPFHQTARTTDVCRFGRTSGSVLVYRMLCLRTKHSFRPNPHGGSLHQIHTPAPNVTRSTPWRDFGSKGWVPRTVVQRLSSFLSGAVFVATGVAFLLGSAGIKTELQSLLPRAVPAAGVISVVGIVVAVVAGLSALLFGARLLTRSVWFRSDTRP